MLPRTLAFLLLFLCLSWGMSASLVRHITAEEEEVPAAETMFRDDTAAAATKLFVPAVDIQVEADTVVAGSLVVDDTPVVEEPVEDTPVAEDLVADKPVADTVVADEFVAEEPVADSPVADAPVADAPVDAPVMADETPDMEALMANMPVVEDPAYMDLESLAKETEIQDAILKDLADQEALEKAMEPEEAAEAEAPAEDQVSPVEPVVEALEEDSDWGLVSIRESLQAADGYFDSLVELMGGRNGVCQYKCKYGKTPVHRHGYVTPEPNGCSSGLLGFQVPDSFDMGIPAMTQCCDQLDSCYDTCGANKNRCDAKYRLCLHAICSDLKKSLGLVSKVKACESVADALYNTVWTLGCRSFKSSQREACYCEGEERDEL